MFVTLGIGCWVLGFGARVLDALRSFSILHNRFHIPFMKYVWRIYGASMAQEWRTQMMQCTIPIKINPDGYTAINAKCPKRWIYFDCG